MPQKHAKKKGGCSTKTYNKQQSENVWGEGICEHSNLFSLDSSNTIMVEHFIKLFKWEIYLIFDLIPLTDQIVSPTSTLYAQKICILVRCYVTKSTTIRCIWIHNPAEFSDINNWKLSLFYKMTNFTSLTIYYSL